MTRLISSRKQGRRRGLTLVEMSVSISILSLVFLIVGSLQLVSARVSKNLYAYSRSQSELYGALDQVRYRLCMGEVGNVDISENQARIDFTDPNLGGVTSSFRFINGSLYYDDDIDSGGGYREVGTGLSNARFVMQPGNAVVGVEMTAPAIANINDSKPITNEARVFLRN